MLPTGTRHPVPAFLFVLPLLVVYEAGVIYLGGPRSEALRNGADAWVRDLLAAAHPRLALVVPVVIALGLAVWAQRRIHDAPDNAPSLMPEMMLESVGFALLLWGLSRLYGPMLDSLGIPLSTPHAHPATRFGQVVTYLGAGIYEEVLFRLVLFSGLIAFGDAIGVPETAGVGLAALLSATLFAAAHHLGQHGEATDGYVFVFRVLAGVYFTMLFRLRGLGVAVGTHACYDVLVGLSYE